MLFIQFIREKLYQLPYQILPLFFPARNVKKSKQVGISMLLCHSDIRMATYSLHSLFYHLGYALPIYIVSDGSLTLQDQHYLKKMFTVEVVPANKALKLLHSRYKKFSWLLKYIDDPQASIKRLRLSAFLLSPFTNTIHLEPDILFENKPEVIDSFSKNGGKYYGVLQPDIESHLIAKNITEHILRKLFLAITGTDIHHLINGGFQLISQDMITNNILTRLNKVVKLGYETGYVYGDYFEEVLISSVFDKQTASELPPEQYVNLMFDQDYHSRKSAAARKQIVLFHFTSFVRYFFMYHAVKMAVRTHFFRQ